MVKPGKQSSQATKTRCLPHVDRCADYDRTEAPSFRTSLPAKKSKFKLWQSGETYIQNTNFPASLTIVGRKGKNGTRCLGPCSYVKKRAKASERILMQPPPRPNATAPWSLDTVSDSGARNRCLFTPENPCGGVRRLWRWAQPCPSCPTRP